MKMGLDFRREIKLDYDPCNNCLLRPICISKGVKKYYECDIINKALTDALYKNDKNVKKISEWYGEKFLIQIPSMNEWLIAYDTCEREGEKIIYEGTFITNDDYIKKRNAFFREIENQRKVRVIR
jgi:hypothetical protein